MQKKGDTWNESQTHTDELTGRTVRRVTTAGLWNEKPGYHTNTTFTADGEFFIFATGRDGKSALCKAHCATGDITLLTDWEDAMGSPQMAHKDPGEFPWGAEGIPGCVPCLAPKSGWAVYLDGWAVKAVNIRTLEQHTLACDLGQSWIAGVISIDASEKNVVIPMMPGHPELIAGKPHTKSYIESFPNGEGMATRYLTMPLTGGPHRDLLIDPGCGSAHCPHSPVDDDLICADRDLPSSFWGGGDDWKTPRCWTLRVSTGEFTPLPPRSEKKFQIHAAWTWDGQYIVYHGFDEAGDGPGENGDWTWYVGVTKPNGEVFREWVLPHAPHYGHVSAAGGDRPAIILDGHISQDRLRFLYYDAEDYRLEDICKHDTDWWSLPGQLTHPHASTDRAGKWIAFNTAHGGRSDIWLVEV